MTSHYALALLAGLSAAGTAEAQYMPDFTGVDFNAVMRDSDLTRRMNQFQQGIQGQARRDPRIVQAYRHYMQIGGYPVTFEVFAEEYYATKGFTDRGPAMRQKLEAQRKEQLAMQGVRDAQERRRIAQTEYMEGFHRNNEEFGNLLEGNSTYEQEGQPVVLPHTWQPNTYHEHNGRLYYVDYSGQYHVVR